MSPIVNVALIGLFPLLLIAILYFTVIRKKKSDDPNAINVDVAKLAELRYTKGVI